MSKLDSYLQALRSGVRTPGCAAGLYGRIIRGTRPEHFEALTHESDRLIVMLLGEDGLENIPGLTGHQMLVDVIKYTAAHIANLTSSGHEFKLVVFEATGKEEVLPATWENTIKVASSVYPLLKGKLEARLDGLKATPFADIEKAAGYNFYNVYKQGEQNPNYMTYARLHAASGTLVEVRAFLFHILHLRELFQGDGYTGAQKEYFLLNRRLDALGNYRLLPVKVDVPAAV